MDDATQRLRAVMVSQSPSELTRRLDDESPEVARAAVRRLVELEGQRAAGALRARVLDADLSVVADIARALRQLGDDAVVGVAVAALRDPAYGRRLAAARALAALRDPRGAVALRLTLVDQIAGVRAACLDALAELGEGLASTRDCAALLTDSDPHVRLAATRAVARLAVRPGSMLRDVASDPDRAVRLELARHVASLPELTADRLLDDPDLRVREAACRGAGIGQLDALALLLRGDPSPDVRLAAAQRLGQFGDVRSADALVDAIEDRNSMIRVAALRALEHVVGRERAVGRLSEELHAERPARRCAALYALSRLSAREATSHVARLARDPDPDVRLALIHTAEALLRHPESHVRRLAEDRDAAVRHSAENWLVRRPGAGP